MKKTISFKNVLYNTPKRKSLRKAQSYLAKTMFPKETATINKKVKSMKNTINSTVARTPMLKSFKNFYKTIK